MKIIAFLLALVTSAAAGLVITASITGVETIRQAASLWLFTKVVSSAGVIISGILVWISTGRSTNEKLVLLSGLFLVALGTASAVWTIHLALVSGHLRDQMFLYGGSLMAQGTASIWTLLIDARLGQGL